MMKNRSIRHLLKTIAATAVTSTILGSSAALAFDWTTVANSDTDIPAGGGVKFSSFGQPSINNNCVVIFRGRATGPSQPVRGLYVDNPCRKTAPGVPPMIKRAAVGDLVPQPNNLDGTFNEFPAFPRIDPYKNFVASRGQSTPVWKYVLPDGSETRVGTTGVYAGPTVGGPLITGASQLGALPDFSYYQVPGFPGVKFDQFPGAPVPFDGTRVAFKGNFTDGTTSRTGVYYRHLYSAGGEVPVRKIADTKTRIPDTSLFFGSTAPPSAAKLSIVFTGLDNEEAPTAGGIYRSTVPPDRILEPLATIGGAVPNAPLKKFTVIGEGLSYDGDNLGYWGGFTGPMRSVTLHCPTDGNKDVIAECQRQCPDVDDIGNFCVREVPVNQGIFVRKPSGEQFMVARAGVGQEFQDFLFWVFSGRPPTEEGDGDAELPRWRSSAFVAVSPRGAGNVATAFKASKESGESGIYLKKTP
ncbi:MAG: hypothetical protein KDE28_28685, partial [Anaerolineales bacterium]|nr:hypothetical protein [Anaerolineales bacterium]